MTPSDAAKWLVAAANTDALALGSYRHVGNHLAYFGLHSSPDALAAAARLTSLSWLPYPAHPAQRGIRILCLFARRLARSVTI